MNADAKNSTAEFLSGVQVVRAIAVCLVLYIHSGWVLDHSNASCTSFWRLAIGFGYAGVDLFFVVSGYIICHISDNRSFDIKDYAARRFLRIFPFYWAFTGFWIVILLLFRKDLLAEHLELSTLAKSLAIFPMEGAPILGVGWSLEHEIIFYIIAGLFMAVGRRKLLAPTLLALFGIGFVVNGVYPSVEGGRVWDYHVFSLFQFQFAVGVLCYEFRKKLVVMVDWRVGAIIGTILLVGTNAILAKYQLSNPEHLHKNTFPIGLFGVIRVIGFGFAGLFFLTSALVASSAIDQSSRTKVMAVILLIGDASYAIYLSHPIVLQAVNKVVGAVFQPGDPLSIVLIVRCVAVVAAIILGVLWHKRIEGPTIRMLHRGLLKRTPKSAV